MKGLLTLILLLALAGATNADPVVFGGAATVTYSAVFSYTTPPVLTFSVTNTSLPLTALTTIGFALPPGRTAAQHAQFTLEGAGALNLVPHQPFTFTVNMDLAPGSTAVFSISGYWFANGAGLTNVQDMMYLYVITPRPASVIPRSALTTETPELTSILLLGTGLFGVAKATRWRRRKEAKQ